LNVQPVQIHLLRSHTRIVAGKDSLSRAPLLGPRLLHRGCGLLGQPVCSGMVTAVSRMSQISLQPPVLLEEGLGRRVDLRKEGVILLALRL